MATSAPAVVRTEWDARVDAARERLNMAVTTMQAASHDYEQALRGSVGIDELHEVLFDRELCEITVARCRADLDRARNWRSYETGAPR